MITSAGTAPGSKLTRFKRPTAILCHHEGQYGNRASDQLPLMFAFSFSFFFLGGITN